MRSASGCGSASQRVRSHGTIPATIIGPPRKTKPTLPEMTRSRYSRDGSFQAKLDYATGRSP